MNFTNSTISVINGTRLDFDRKLKFQQTFGESIQVHYDIVGKDPTDEEIISRSSDCNVIITKEIKISSELIELLPSSVKVIVEAGTGYNNISLDACRKRGITVMNVPNYSNEAVASLVITFLLNFSSSLMLQYRILLQNDLTNFKTSLSVPHFEVSGKTLGLVGGRGSIGSKVMEIAKVLGMKIIISTRQSCIDSKLNSDINIKYTSSIEELLQNSDFVSLHCPLTTETQHLINKSTLSLMKPTSYLINTARGGLINENDLIEALTNNTIAGK